MSTLQEAAISALSAMFSRPHYEGPPLDVAVFEHGTAVAVLRMQKEDEGSDNASRASVEQQRDAFQQFALSYMNKYGEVEAGCWRGDFDPVPLSNHPSAPLGRICVMFSTPKEEEGVLMCGFPSEIVKNDTDEELFCLGMKQRNRRQMDYLNPGVALLLHFS